MKLRVPKKSRPKRPAQKPPRRSQTAANVHRREFRQWRASLPTVLERETLLLPEAIADSVVAEASHFLNADLPADFAERLADKAYRLYPRHAHFRKVLRRPGNEGRAALYMYMRHWTAAWLKRERRSLFNLLPRSFALGQRIRR